MVTLRNTARRYGAVAQGLHWIIVLLLVTQYGLAWYAGSLPRGALMSQLFTLHKSLGILVLGLAVLRLCWRAFDRPPPLPEMARWERIAAHLGHGLLYILLFAQPISGLVMAWASKYPPAFFGWVLPNPIGLNSAVHEAGEAAHEWISYALLIVVAGHVAAALRHHWWLRDEVLVRMLPGHFGARSKATGR
jgi:cytochrome b561